LKDCVWDKSFENQRLGFKPIWNKSFGINRLKNNVWDKSSEKDWSWHVA